MKTTPMPQITTTPTFWRNEFALTRDPLTVGAHITAVRGDTVMIGWSSGNDLFGFQLSPFGNVATVNLFTELTSAVAVPLSAPQFVQQSDGSLIAEYQETIPILGTGLEGDVMWHLFNTNDGDNATPIAGSGQIETFHDATATTSGGSAVIYETFQGDRFFQNLQFVNGDGTKSAGAILVGTHANESQIDPSIVGLPSGNVAVVYENFRPSAGVVPEERDIRLHIFTPAGGEVAEGVFGSREVLVSGLGRNALLPDMAIANAGTPNKSGDDQLVVAWQDDNGIEFRRFASERGAPIDEAPRTIANSGDGIVPHVVALKDGGFIVEWGQSFGREADGTRDFGLVLQRFDKNGDPVGDRVIIDNPGDQGPFGVGLATLEDGRVMVTFNSETGDSTDLTTLDCVILDPRDRTIKGTDAIDFIVGRRDASTIIGLGGDDKLTGMKGDDALIGGTGRDRLIGGVGADILLGGADADVFDFDFVRQSKAKAFDVIKDFHHAEGDRIDLSDIDVDPTLPGDQSFHFIGDKRFHHKAGELHFVRDHNHGVFLEGDVDGDGRADLRIAVQHVHHLAGSDFLFAP